MLTDEQITAIVREASRGAAFRRDGTTSQRIARAVWDLATEEAAKVCQDQSIRFCEAMNGKAAYGAVECERAIRAMKEKP